MTTFSWNISKPVAALHKDSPVWGNHGCLPGAIAGKEECPAQLQRYRDSGVNLIMALGAWK